LFLGRNDDVRTSMNVMMNRSQTVVLREFTEVHEVFSEEPEMSFASVRNCIMPHSMCTRGYEAVCETEKVYFKTCV
jgi:hypothetical protein